jgi:hypothetical protein
VSVGANSLSVFNKIPPKFFLQSKKAEKDLPVGDVVKVDLFLLFST